MDDGFRSATPMVMGSPPYGSRGQGTLPGAQHRKCRQSNKSRGKVHQNSYDCGSCGMKKWANRDIQSIFNPYNTDMMRIIL